MPETIVGTRTKLELVSETHGSVRVPLNQNFDYTPRFTERVIFEFDNDEAALIVSSFDGVDIRFDYLDSDSKLVDAALNDLDPGASVTVMDHSTLKSLNIFLNVKGEDGVIFQSILAKGVRVKGAATTEPVREESSVTIDGTATNVLRVKGAAILYTRILHDTPDVSVFLQGSLNSSVDKNFPANPGPYTVAFDETAVNLGGGEYALLVLKNDEIADTADYTLTAADITLTAEPADTDVWEVYTTYID